MISLSGYVGKKPIECDAHTHLFDGSDTDLSLLLPQSKLTVTFADIKYRDPDAYAEGVLPKAYDNFISRRYQKIKDKVVLLATSSSAEEAISIYEKHKDVIKGFGEFQCYGWSTYWDKRLPYGNLHWIEPVLEYDKDKKLPFYIHYDLVSDKRVNDLERVLKKYPEIPIVLCHCGMDNCTDSYGALDAVSRLMDEYQNLWTDISYAALEIFAADRTAINKLAQDRVLLGSDLNPILKNKSPQDYRVTVDSIVRNMEVVNGYGVDFYGNLKRLFGMS